MRRALVLVMLTLMLIPLVSAQTISYYPNKVAFQRFLASNSSYHVISGTDGWAKGWAYYVDSRLKTIKKHGNETLVLVGNVYENPKMRSLWRLTDLPENASLLPSVIVANDTVFITGTQGNIYQTERAFSSLWNPPTASVVGFTLLALLVFFLFLLALRRDKTHAEAFYLVMASILGLWYLVTKPPEISIHFLPYLLQGVEFATGSTPSSPLGLLLGVFFKAVPPIEEDLIYIHWVLILLIASFSFYIVPKRSRELGFLVFGLTFSTPLFRSFVHHVDTTTIGLAFFVSTLALIANVTFSPERGKALLQTILLSLLTVLTVAINPYFILMPLAFIIAFPKRHFRNYAYLVTTGIGILLLYLKFGLPIHMPSHPVVSLHRYLLSLLMSSALSAAVILYAVFHIGRIEKMKGQTPFLTLLVLAYLPLSVFNGTLTPYCLIILAALATRLLYLLTSKT